MGDMAEGWGELRAERAAKRADNRARGIQNLKEAGISYVELNGGAHLRINCHVDYWPGTGLWRDLNTKREGRGVFKLIRYLKEQS